MYPSAPLGHQPDYYQSRGMSADPRETARRLGTNAGFGLTQAMDEAQQNRAAMTEGLGFLRSGALGEQPSVAQSMLQQAGEQNQAQAANLAHQTRGGDAAGANRAALAASLGMQAQTQHQMAQLRAQEMQQAQSAYVQAGLGMGDQNLRTQAMLNQQQGNILGMQFADDAHRRQADLEGRKYKTARNMGWTQYGTNVAGSVLEGLGF